MDRSPLHFASPVFKPRLSRSEQKAVGAYYTPPQIVRLVLDLALGGEKHQRPPRLVDPSCGAGEFMVEALQHLIVRFGAERTRRAIWGIDSDAAAVDTARSRLRGIDDRFPTNHVQVGDALADGIFAAESFDLVVGNPPYVNIRRLSKCFPREAIIELRRRFVTARGNFDLYPLFVERALALLRPGGRCAFVVPNKWATLEYARPCRELLLANTTIEHVIDMSAARTFTGASVYPHILVFRKRPAGARHRFAFRNVQTGAVERIEQRALSPAAIHLAAPLDVESRIRARPLAEAASLACGTTGYTSQRIVRHLLDDSQSCLAKGAHFITSGNIDRYAIRLGNVRFLNRDYSRPRLPLDTAELTPATRRLFAEPKIVIAGLSRRLEAAWDERGLALGVQVFAASRFQVDPFYLLALLNSRLLSYLFATRFAAKRLGGGYLAVNKGQLAQLPIAISNASVRDRLTELVTCRLGRTLAGSESANVAESADFPKPMAAANPTAAATETEIDRLVYRLYCLTEAEIARVESHFAELRLAAA